MSYLTAEEESKRKQQYEFFRKESYRNSITALAISRKMYRKEGLPAGDYIKCLQRAVDSFKRLNYPTDDLLLEIEKVKNGSLE